MRLTLGLGLAPVTAVDAIMTGASQLPAAALTASVDAVFVTSSNVMAYCGAHASRRMRFYGSRKEQCSGLRPTVLLQRAEQLPVSSSTVNWHAAAEPMTGMLQLTGSRISALTFAKASWSSSFRHCSG
jgi:hypothetical protein